MYSFYTQKNSNIIYFNLNIKRKNPSLTFISIRKSVSPNFFVRTPYVCMYVEKIMINDVKCPIMIE